MPTYRQKSKTRRPKPERRSNSEGRRLRLQRREPVDSDFGFRVSAFFRPSGSRRAVAPSQRVGLRIGLYLLAFIPRPAAANEYSCQPPVNPWFLSASTRPNPDHQNLQHFKGLQSISKQMSEPNQLRTPHSVLPRESATIRGYPRLSTVIHAKK
jgi:hypothetical protein